MKSLIQYINEVSSKVLKSAAEKAKSIGDERWKKFQDAYLKKLAEEENTKIDNIKVDVSAKVFNDTFKEYKPQILKYKKYLNKWGDGFQVTDKVFIKAGNMYESGWKNRPKSPIDIKVINGNTKISMSFALMFSDKVWKDWSGNADEEDMKTLFCGIILSKDGKVKPYLENYSGDTYTIRTTVGKEKFREEMEEMITTMEKCCKDFNPDINIDWENV